MKDLLESYNKLLVLCPHCGADGVFETEMVQDIEAVQSVCKGCGNRSAQKHLSKENVIRLIDDWGKGAAVPRLNLPTDRPVIVNLGGGVDSVALLVEMVREGIKPDLIIFADVGGERPETYQYLEFFDVWLQEHGFPAITRVAYVPATAPYTDLESNCLANETLPSISFRKKSCTLKFKAAVMDAFILGIKRGPNKKEGWAPALEALAKGVKAVKLIGYDAGPIDSCRSINLTEDANFIYQYPLRHLGWTREDCMLAIARAGLPRPIKSSCFYCASCKPYEVYWMAADHPDLLKRALVMEDTARNGKHGLKEVNGLWGHGESWREFCETRGIIAPGTYEVIAEYNHLIAEARKTKPPLESNLYFKLPEKLKVAA